MAVTMAHHFEVGESFIGWNRMGDAFLPLPFPCFPLSVPVAVVGNPFGGKGGTF